MTVAVRAIISVVMLAGFYVLALVQLVAGAALAFWVWSWFGAGFGTKIGVAVFLATVWAVGYGTWKALNAAGAGPHGLALDEHDAPRLWETVRELSDEVGTRAPDEIYLVSEVNAAVGEQPRLMGLLAGPRYLYIGMPLLQTLTVAQLRAVLAHELGHYSEQHTRFAGISYRGRLALERTVGHIGRRNVAGWVFRAYARLFVLVHNAVSRRQEIEADLTAVRISGRHATAAALEEVEILGVAYDFYIDTYILPGLGAGCVPEDFFAGFAELLRVRAEELSALRAAQRGDDQRKANRWSTHPPLAARLAAIMAAPEPAADLDDGPATALVGDARAAGRELQEEMLPAAGFVVLPWDEFRSATGNAALQDRTDELLRTVSRAVNRPVPHVGAVLDHIEAGRINRIAAPVFPGVPKAEARKRFAEPLAMMLSLAAVRSGAARWRHPWSGPSQLLAKDGAELDLAEIAELATDPATLPGARQRLAGLGIDAKAAKHVQQVVNAKRARIYGGIHLMKIDGRRADLLILSHGLLIMPPVSRIRTRLAWFRMNKWIQEGSAQALAATPGSWFIPYEEIAGAQRTGRLRFRWRLTLHDGSEVELRKTMESDGHGDSETMFVRAILSATG
jgi:Zn-dependent protease with chaperone function